MIKCKFVILSLLLLIFAQSGIAQDSDPGNLTLERIFSSREFSRERFGPAFWSNDGSSYTTLEPSGEIEGSFDIVQYNPNNHAQKIVISAAQLIPVDTNTPLNIENYAIAPDDKTVLIYTNSQRVWRQNTRGDYWLLNLDNWDLNQLGGVAPSSSLMFATYSPNSDNVAFISGNNIYVEDMRTKNITQLTFDGSNTIINGTFDWVYEEELSLRNGYRWSPDGKHIAFWQLDAEEVGEFYMINTTDSIYTKIVPVQYPKAGTTNSAARIGVVNTRDGAKRWLDIPGNPQEQYIARMEWAHNSEEVVIQLLNRLQNTLQIIVGNIETGETTTVFTEQDEAWVDINDDFRWIENGDSFIWFSERDGWKHIYKISINGNEIVLLTPGNFDVVSIQSIDEKNGVIYFVASPDYATQRYLYRTSLEGSGEIVRITPDQLSGTHSYNISPNSQWAFHTYSSYDIPPITELISLPDHTSIVLLNDNESLHTNVSKLKKNSVEFFQISISEDDELDAWLIKPYNFDPQKRYPLLLYLYGGPAAQTVLDRWSGSRYLWHQMLAQEGYLVMSIDNRGTPAPRGRDWRKVIYKKIGILDTSDQAKALRSVLLERSYIDPERIGIWGWSGGGTMSLNQIFRYPDLYKTAIAVAPVTDLRLYDTIYQERYMGLPDENSYEYTIGSPIAFAENLEGNLLIIHGTGDDNVHYQNTEVLVNELVRNNKHFSMMSYPNRTHGIYEGKNTSRHLYELMTRYLRENLPVH